MKKSKTARFTAAHSKTSSRKGRFESLELRLHLSVSQQEFLPESVARNSDIGTMEFYNGFDDSKPTMVAAHGWFGSVDFQDTFGRSPSFADKANVIGWEWDANIIFDIISTARSSGRELGQELSTFIVANVPDYDQPIQLVGHSLGTHVVLAAAAELRDIGRNDPNFATYQADQVTLVDTGFSGPIQGEIDEIMDDYLVPLKMDNYWSPVTAGGTGRAYSGELANVRVPLRHTDIWSWFFTTLDDQPANRPVPGATYSVVGPLADENFGAITAVMVSGQSTPLDVSDDVFVLVSPDNTRQIDAALALLAIATVGDKNDSLAQDHGEFDTNAFVVDFDSVDWLRSSS